MRLDVVSAMATDAEGMYFRPIDAIRMNGWMHLSKPIDCPIVPISAELARNPG
jgi:hypothetical protein